MRQYWSALYLVVAIALIVVIGLIGALPLPVRWVLVMAVFIVLLALIGRDITGRDSDVPLRRGRSGTRFVPGRLDGVLIDLRHKISLSRLQLVLWTVVVLSAWITLALHRTIPVLQGRLLASEAGLVDEVAGLLAGGRAVTPAETDRATAVLEQLMGGDMTPAAGEELPAYSPLDINFPPEVLAALGISIASLAGASVIKTNQASNEDGRANEIVNQQMERAGVAAATASNQAAALESAREATLESLRPSLEAMDGEEPPPPDPAAVQAVQAQVAALETRLKAAETAAARAEERAAKMQEVQATAVGELHTRPSIADARWSDMLRGDTVANFQYADLGKVQMFFFTIVLVFAYAALIWSIMSMPMAEQILQLAPTLRLPAFSESLVLILGLSHGGYLVTKNAA